MAQQQQLRTMAEVHQGILDASRNITENRWAIAQGLSTVMQIRGWREFGHLTFEEYVDAEMPFGLRNAQAMVRVYEKIDALGIDVSEVGDIGWSKVETILPVLTRENADYWFQQARDLGVRKLEEDVKAELHPGRVTQAEQTPVTRRFNLDTSQSALVEDALTQCKAMTGAGSDSESLTLICTDFLENKGSLPLEKAIELLEQRHRCVLTVTNTKQEGMEGVHVTDKDAERIFEHESESPDPEETGEATSEDFIDERKAGEIFRMV